MEQTTKYGTKFSNPDETTRQGILTFNLPEEQNAFEIAVKSMDWALVAWDLDQWLRGNLKDGHKFKTADEVLEAVRAELRRILDAYNLTLEMIE